MTSEKVMFADYTFTVDDNKIEFDRELSPEQLNVKEGDQFSVTIKEGKIVFVRNK
jgi:formylmethanofuran dehydrogenase subunit D